MSETPYRYTAEMAGQIEVAWQDRWQESGTYHAPNPAGPSPHPATDQSSNRPGTPRAARSSRAGYRGRLPAVAVLAVLALGGGAAALTAGMAPPPAPIVVPYPTVTGTLGDHRQQLQKSVEP